MGTPAPMETGEDLGFHESGIIGGCEPQDVGSGNLVHVLWKRDKCWSLFGPRPSVLGELAGTTCQLYGYLPALSLLLSFEM